MNLARRNGLILQDVHFKEMEAWAQAVLPEEACGLLEGKGHQVVRVIPIENQLHSPVRFMMEPAAQLRAFQVMESGGYELVGFFHSHPAGPAHPSETDITEFYYPGAVSVILSLASGVWVARGFWIDAGFAGEVPLILGSAAEK